MSQRIGLYGQGVAKLKKERKLLLDLSERLELPAEASVGAAKLSVTAGRRVLIENHRGILDYGSERICVGLEQGKLILSGTELCLLAMDRKEMLIGGKLQNLEWEE